MNKNINNNMNNNINKNINNSTPLAPKDTAALIRKSMQRRHAAEKRFKLYGLTAISIALLAVVLLFVDILIKGLPAFWETSIRLDIYFDPAIITPEGQHDPHALDTADYSALWKKSLRQLFPEVQDRTELRSLYVLISSGASLQLRDRVIANPELIGTTQSVVLPADHTVDTFVKGGTDRELPEAQRLIKDDQIAWLDKLKAAGRLVTCFNTIFFTGGDSREPEQAGIAGAVVGSLFTDRKSVV